MDGVEGCLNIRGRGLTIQEAKVCDRRVWRCTVGCDVDDLE